MKVKIIVSVLNEQDEVERETVKEYRLEGITPKQAQSAERVVVYSQFKDRDKAGLVQRAVQVQPCGQSSVAHRKADKFLRGLCRQTGGEVFPPTLFLKETNHGRKTNVAHLQITKKHEKRDNGSCVLRNEQSPTCQRLAGYFRPSNSF